MTALMHPLGPSAPYLGDLGNTRQQGLILKGFVPAMVLEDLHAGHGSWRRDTGVDHTGVDSADKMCKQPSIGSLGIGLWLILSAAENAGI